MTTTAGNKSSDAAPPPTLDRTSRSIGHVEITIVVAHNDADRKGRTIQPLKRISVQTNSTARVVRVRSRRG
jgi:hypothetical protein